MSVYEIAYDCFYTPKIVFVVDSSGVASVVYDQILTLPLYFEDGESSQTSNPVNTRKTLQKISFFIYAIFDVYLLLQIYIRISYMQAF